MRSGVQTIERSLPSGTPGVESTTHGSLAELFRRDAASRTTIGVQHAVRRVEEALLQRTLPATRVGRYVLEEVVGAGGAGVVYRAYDPQLGRRVALKLLRPRSGAEGERVDQRLLAEARALASVDHENVVGVYDVGVFDDNGKPRIFLVMEWMEGSNLSEWRHEAPSANEIVVAYVAACRGLEAVHACGVLHRDFKPANALRDRKGVVKVADFGLAAPLVRRDAGSTEEQVGLNERTDAVLAGTPRYMAPEQHDGVRLDARADQYALCVALFEALCGRPPFRAASLAELACRKRGGPPVFPRRADVPPGVERAILRGLQPQPDDRFASMAELADELERASRGTRRSGAARYGLAAAVVLGFVGIASDERPEPCGSPAEVEWSESERLAVRRALADAGPTGVRAFTAVEASLDAYVDGLRRAGVRACDLPEEARQIVRPCLDHRRESVHALVAALVDASSPRFARSAVRDLPPIDACWARGTAVPIDDAARRQLQDELLPAVVLQSLGRYAEALERVDATRRRRASAPSLGDAELIRAELLAQVGRPAEGAAAMESLFFHAVEANDARTSAAVAMALVGLSYERGRFDDALRWSEHARAHLDSLEPVAPSRRVAWLHNTAMAHFWAGDLDRARRLLAEAEAWLEGETLVAEIDAIVHGSQGTVLLFAGEAELALEEHEREIAIRHDLYGDADPGLVGAHLNEGNALSALGRDREALEAFAHAEALAVEAGREDIDAVSAALSRIRMEARIDPRVSLAFESRRAVGRLGNAAPAHRAAAAVVAGEVIRMVEGCEAAIDPLRDAIADLEDAVGAGHHAVGTSYAELAVALEDCGRPAEARGALDRGLEILRATLPAGHPQIEELEDR